MKKRSHKNEKPDKAEELTQKKELELEEDEHIEVRAVENEYSQRLLEEKVLMHFQSSIGKVIKEIDKNVIMDNPWVKRQDGHVETIYIEGSHINHIPDSIQHLKYLRELHMRNNNLKELPSCMANLKNLTSLDLSQNNLRKIPNILRDLPLLKSLNLSHNRIENLTRVEIQISEGNQSKEVKLPKEEKQAEKGVWEHIQEIHLDHNKLTKFPQFLKSCPNVKRISLGYNKIERIPSWIQELKSLQYLSLKGNPLKRAPQTLTGLQNIEILNLDMCKIEKIPPWFSELDNLKELNLNNNGLTSFPKYLTKLKNLRHLEMNNNDLYFLPRGIKRMKNLQVFYLNQNKIDAIPEDFSDLGSLEALFMANNPLRLIPNTLKPISSHTTELKEFCKKLKKWNPNRLIQKIKSNEEIDYVDTYNPKLGPNLGYILRKISKFENEAKRNFLERIQKDFSLDLKNQFKLVL